MRFCTAKGKAELFVDEKRLPPEVKAALKAVAVVYPPNELGRTVEEAAG